MASKEIPLNWDVFVAKRRGLTRDLPPGKEQLNWVGGSATLIYGGSDAVLVDTLLTIDQNRALADWIGARRKNLTTIYATHGHGHHFFGVNTIQLGFPSARFVASRDAISVMRGQLSPPVLEALWKSRFPGQIDPTLPIAEDLAGAVIQLEGEEFVSIPTGHTDTRSTTCLHVPSIGLVVAGDAAYTDVHVHLGESTG